MSRRGTVRNKAHDEESPEPEAKRSNKRSSQQPSTSQESAVDGEEGWACAACTFKNSFESFKCEMCESRKGTSTRKPRLNPNVVQQQTLVQLAAQQQSQSPSTRKVRGTDKRFSPESNDSGSPTPSRVIKKPPKAKKDKEKRIIPFPNEVVFRNSPKKRTITVRGISFIITEYKAKRNPKTLKSKRALDKQSKKEESV
ncbi:RanBP2-type domain-containing protein [Aphelenchoides bicaudatus]|nr:RanBP2-type domain-containing protein [Aphelenchoides bicaudatus]